MAETIPGGAYLASDGETWVDSEGKPLEKANAAEAQKTHDERAAELAEAEKVKVMLDAQRDPTARAIMAMQQQSSSAGRVEPPAQAPTMQPSGKKP